MRSPSQADHAWAHIRDLNTDGIPYLQEQARLT